MTTNTAHLVTTDPVLVHALPGSGFADAFRIALTPEQARLSAGELAQQLFSRTPEWIALLLAIRNRVVALFGLRAANMHIDGGPATSMAGFPLVSQSDELVQLGFDDKHLDFRIWVRRDQATADLPAQLTLTTVVRTNRLLGRIYLGVIMPFHRRIAPAMLNGLYR